MSLGSIANSLLYRGLVPVIRIVILLGTFTVGYHLPAQLNLCRTSVRREWNREAAAESRTVDGGPRVFRVVAVIVGSHAPAHLPRSACRRRLDKR